MKQLLFTLLVLALAVQATAQMKPLTIITYDSLGADAFNVSLGTGQDTNNIVGLPNNSEVALTSPGDWVFAQFYHGGVSPVVFQQGAHINFYWSRSLQDSSHMWLILRHYVGDWINLDGPGDTIFVNQYGTGEHVTTMPVVGSGYNTVEVHLDTTRGALPIYLDAIVLVQHGTLDSVGITSGVSASLTEAADFSCYPNPFVRTSGATLHSEEASARATYVVMDMLGREVARLDGSADAHFTPPATGAYFVRRRIGNEWRGEPLRISAE